MASVSQRSSSARGCSTSGCSPAALLDDANVVGASGLARALATPSWKRSQTSCADSFLRDFGGDPGAATNCEPGADVLFKWGFLTPLTLSSSFIGSAFGVLGPDARADCDAVADCGVGGDTDAEAGAAANADTDEVTDCVDAQCGQLKCTWTWMIDIA